MVVFGGRKFVQWCQHRLRATILCWWRGKDELPILDVNVKVGRRTRRRRWRTVDYSSKGERAIVVVDEGWLGKEEKRREAVCAKEEGFEGRGWWSLKPGGVSLLLELYCNCTWKNAWEVRQGLRLCALVAFLRCRPIDWRVVGRRMSEFFFLASINSFTSELHASRQENILFTVSARINCVSEMQENPEFLWFAAITTELGMLYFAWFSALFPRPLLFFSVAPGYRISSCMYTSLRNRLVTQGYLSWKCCVAQHFLLGGGSPINGAIFRFFFRCRGVRRLLWDSHEMANRGCSHHSLHTMLPLSLQENAVSLLLYISSPPRICFSMLNSRFVFALA